MLILHSIVVLAKNPEDPWKASATLVCKQITDALDFYKKGDIKQAQTQAIMAYFKGYDAEIEPAVRITQGGKHVFEVEHQFRDFKNAMTPNPDAKKLTEVTTRATKLCQTMFEDAESLKLAKVKKEVFKVN